MTTPIFRFHYSILELLQGPNLLPYSFSALFLSPPRIHPHVIHPPLFIIEVGIFEGKEEVGKKLNGWKEEGAHNKIMIKEGEENGCYRSWRTR